MVSSAMRSETTFEGWEAGAKALAAPRRLVRAMVSFMTYVFDVIVRVPSSLDRKLAVSELVGIFLVASSFHNDLSHVTIQNKKEFICGEIIALASRPAGSKRTLSSGWLGLVLLSIKRVLCLRRRLDLLGRRPMALVGTCQTCSP